MRGRENFNVVSDTRCDVNAIANDKSFSLRQSPLFLSLVRAYVYVRLIHRSVQLCCKQCA